MCLYKVSKTSTYKYYVIIYRCISGNNFYTYRLLEFKQMLLTTTVSQIIVFYRRNVKNFLGVLLLIILFNNKEIFEVDYF